MSEYEWREFREPEALLVYLQKQGRDPLASKRKSGLLAVACCRRMWDLLPEAQRRAVEVAERVAEGETMTEEEWDRIADRVEDGEGFGAWGPIAECATSAIYASFIDFRIHRVFSGCAEARAWGQALTRRPHLAWRPDRLRELRGSDNIDPQLDDEVRASIRKQLEEQCGLVLEVFGHLFHAVTVQPVSLTSAAIAVAREIYDGRRFADLPILADALEEAGVTDPNILGHCRSDGPHFRGCWVLDLVLGKP